MQLLGAKNRLLSIDERPAIVNEKTRFGDLEIDTIIGKNHKGAILTITDRVKVKYLLNNLEVM